MLMRMHKLHVYMVSGISARQDPGQDVLVVPQLFCETDGFVVGDAPCLTPSLLWTS